MNFKFFYFYIYLSISIFATDYFPLQNGNWWLYKEECRFRWEEPSYQYHYYKILSFISVVPKVYFETPN